MDRWLPLGDCLLPLLCLTPLSQDLCTMGPLIRAVEQGRFKNELGAPRLLFVVLTVCMQVWNWRQRLSSTS